MNKNNLKIIAKRIKFHIETLCYPIFCIRGKRPFSLGYNYYRKKELLKCIGTDGFTHDKLTDGFGYRIDERIIEYPWAISRLPYGAGRLLDAGSALNHDFLLEVEAIRSKKLFISTLAPEAHCHWYKNISYVYEDLRKTCYMDNFFDYIVSISTIEHIGFDNTQLYTSDGSKNENDSSSYSLAIREFWRILKPGGKLFITVPFGKYANHHWFQVFDYSMINNLIDVFNGQSHMESYYRYFPTGWQKVDCEMLKDVAYFDINSQKKFDPDYAAAARGVACIELTK